LNDYVPFLHTMNIRLVLVLLAAMVLAALTQVPPPSADAQTCTPPPSGNVQIQSGGATNSYGASGRTLQGRVNASFSATIQTLGISSPLSIGITGLPVGITQKANPLYPLGGPTFSGTTAVPGTYALVITLENDCGAETYTVPLSITSVSGTPSPAPPPSGGTGMTPVPNTPGQLLQTLLEVPLCALLSCANTESLLLTGRYSSSGHFVISGHVNVEGRGGVWAFAENGQAAGVGNLLRDVGVTFVDVHSQGITPMLEFNGSSGFVHSTENVNPTLSFYEFSGGQLVHRSRTPETSVGTKHDSDFAVANGHVVIRYTTPPNELVTYRLPGFIEVNSRSSSLVPIMGVGNFIVAAATNAATAQVGVYRMESDGEMVFVENLPELTRFSALVNDIDDSSGPRRVRFFDYRFLGSSSVDVITYSVGATGFDFVGRQAVQFPEGFGTSAGTGERGFHPFAVNGNTMALAMCERNRTVSNGTCGAGVYVGGVYQGLVPAPSFTDSVEGEYGRGWAVGGVDISPSGKMVVVNRFGAQLWQIGTSAPVPGIPGAPGTGVDTSIFLDAARQYIDLLKLFFNAR
jgi:hypothetical protein